MNRFNVVMTSPALAPAAVSILEAAGCMVHYTEAYPSGAAIAALAAGVSADAILARQGRVTGEAIAASPRLRIVARHGVGTDEVDLEAAASRGILVTNAPGTNTAAVAEHTLALILALVKDLKPLGAVVAGGGWRGPASRTRDLAGMRLGLVGCGAIGRAVGRLAAAFGIEVAAYDPAMPAGGFPGIESASSLRALAARSDILSLHCPLTEATRGLVDAAVFYAMPAGGLVVNTARGSILDETALLAALDAGRISGAALDVFAAEPPAVDSPLRNHPCVLVTPHLAGVSSASLEAMGVAAAECIVLALCGGLVPPERIVVRA
jgi:D-3-phosphoglycerate dehydrogenase